MSRLFKPILASTGIVLTTVTVGTFVSSRQEFHPLQKSQEPLLSLKRLSDPVVSILTINTIVFLCWNSPFKSLQRWLQIHFTHYPLSRKTATLFTSTISHKSFMHYFFNMYALSSFLPMVQSSAKMSNEETLSFYVNAGILSSLGSHAVSILFRNSILPSLGASGGLWAVLSALSLLRPHSHVQIMFLPWSFELQDLVPCMVLVDIVGLLRGWQRMDHAAHLTGALVGYAYIHLNIHQHWKYLQSQWKKLKVY